jgi:hypothetical protein
MSDATHCPFYHIRSRSRINSLSPSHTQGERSLVLSLEEACVKEFWTYSKNTMGIRFQVKIDVHEIQRLKDHKIQFSQSSELQKEVFQTFPYHRIGRVLVSLSRYPRVRETR